MPAHRKPAYEKCVSMYESGMSIQQIAVLLGVSRQSMHAALKVRGCKFRSNLRFGLDNNFHRDGGTGQVPIVAATAFELLKFQKQNNHQTKEQNR